MQFLIGICSNLAQTTATLMDVIGHAANMTSARKEVGWVVGVRAARETRPVGVIVSTQTTKIWGRCHASAFAAH